MKTPKLTFILWISLAVLLPASSVWAQSGKLVKDAKETVKIIKGGQPFVARPAGMPNNPLAFRVQRIQAQANLDKVYAKKFEKQNAEKRAQQIKGYGVAGRQNQQLPARQKMFETQQPPAIAPREEVPAWTQQPGESTMAYFHRLTRDNIEAPEVTGDSYQRNLDLGLEPKPAPANKRSYESLVTEGAARGILPQGWSKMSREELEAFLTPVIQAQEIANSGESWVQTIRKARRLGYGEETFVGKVSAEVEKWAQKQPNFIEDNYVYGRYPEPFNENVTSLRVLFVNDVTFFVENFLEYAKQDPRITADHVFSGVDAIERLKKDPTAYDIIFTDLHMRGGTGLQVSSYVLANDLPIPVIFSSAANAMPGWLYDNGFNGRLYTSSPEDVFSYASNMVATGRAFPRRK